MIDQNKRLVFDTYKIIVLDIVSVLNFVPTQVNIVYRSEPSEPINQYLYNFTPTCRNNAILYFTIHKVKQKYTNKQVDHNNFANIISVRTVKVSVCGRNGGKTAI